MNENMDNARENENVSQNAQTVYSNPTENPAESHNEPPRNPQLPREAPAAAGFSRESNPYGSYSAYGIPTEPPKAPVRRKKKCCGKAWLRVVAAILVIGLAFGGGYYGAMLALRNAEEAAPKVIIQQSAGDASDGSDTADAAGTLNSEQVAAKTAPSVVAITTEQMTTGSYWFGSYVTGGAGSGVIISKDGYIITNNHVIEDATTMTVELMDGTEYEATLVGTYPEGDIAVIKIEAADLTPATFADSDALVQGTAVYAVGNPEGKFSGSITDGIVSALGRTIQVSSGDSSSSYGFGFGYSQQSSYITLHVIQFSAAVSPGNSGGGLFDDNGELVGIVCAKSSDTDSEGLSFAIPSNTALEIANSLITTGTYEGGTEEDGDSGVTPTTNKAMLGITALTLTQEQAESYGLSSAGVYVGSVTAESTMQAGLKSGDRIISIDNTMVSEVTDVTDYLADFNPGDKVTLAVERSGQMLSIEITLVENPDAAE